MRILTDPDLSSLLNIRAGSLVSIVGAGGKTTTMYRLCHELASRGLRVVSTTTTAIQRPLPRQSPLLLMESDLPDLHGAVREALDRHGHVTVGGRAWREDKLKGIGFHEAARLLDAADVVVIEADGARHKRIKAPAEHEPVVPPESSHFLSVAGLHALGQPLELVCHRPELAAAITGQPAEARVNSETLWRLLAAPGGGLKGKPEGAQAWALLTHLTDNNEEDARAIARHLRGVGHAGVVALSQAGALVLED